MYKHFAGIWFLIWLIQRVTRTLGLIEKTSSTDFRSNDLVNKYFNLYRIIFLTFDTYAQPSSYKVLPISSLLVFLTRWIQIYSKYCKGRKSRPLCRIILLSTKWCFVFWKRDCIITLEESWALYLARVRWNVPIMWAVSKRKLTYFSGDKR